MSSPWTDIHSAIWHMRRETQNPMCYNKPKQNNGGETDESESNNSPTDVGAYSGWLWWRR